MARKRKTAVQKPKSLPRLRTGLDLQWTPEQKREKLHERG